MQKTLPIHYVDVMDNTDVFMDVTTGLVPHKDDILWYNDREWAVRKIQRMFMQLSPSPVEDGVVRTPTTVLTVFVRIERL